MGEKTEKATPKKLRDARKKGQVAKSQDLPSAFTFIASCLLTLWLAPWMFKEIGGFLTTTFQMVASPNLLLSLGTLYEKGLILSVTAALPVLLLVSMLGVMINFLAIGPTFSTEVFKPDIKKFNPVENLKAKFKMKTLIELLKSIVKISIASYIIYTVIYKSLPVLTKAVTLPMDGSLLLFSVFLKEVVIKVGLFFIVIAIFDFAYQKKVFAKEMKMEKFEVKQEYKNTEGDPQIKGKRRQIAQEIAYSEGAAGGVKKAKAVVTNPTHLAIAIGYEQGVDPAPYILGMGSDLLATRMISIAKEYNIPVIRNIKLAHKLWDDGEVYEFVPEETYGVLAEIIRWVAALNTNEEFSLEFKE